MHRVTTVAVRAIDWVLETQRPGRALGLGRSLLALAQASVVLLTPADRFLVPLGESKEAVDCSAAARALNPFCLDNVDPQIVAWVVGAVFLLVASGIWPRVTAVLHLAATYSISTAISLPDGGEAVALVVTFFLVFALAGDRRRWHWQQAETSRGTLLDSVGCAGFLLVKLQVAYIYLNSSLAKLSVDAWQEGTATYYVARMESFGAAGLGAPLFRWATATPTIEIMLAWGTIVGELLIAITLLLPGRGPRVGWFISVALHLGIIIFLGIVSFGLTMIAVVTMAASPALTRAPVGRPVAATASSSGTRPTRTEAVTAAAD